MKSLSPAKSRTLAGIIFVLIITAGSGCGPVRPLELIQDPYLPVSYPAALDEWTRKGRIYTGGLDLELITSATFKSAAFRKAYAVEHARVYKLGPAETEKMLRDQADAAEMHSDFVVSAFTPEKQWNDFNQKDSIWKVYLRRSDGLHLEPLEIRRFRNVDAVLTHFFPHITPWDRVYLFRFATLAPGSGVPSFSAEAGRLELVITSVLGSAELVWEYRGSGIGGQGTGK